MGLLVAGGSVAFDEVVGYPKISCGRESRSITRVGRIAWANIDAAILECFPAPPNAWGAHPTASYLYAESLEIEPFHPDAANLLVSGSVASYAGDALATIKYGLWPNKDVKIQIHSGGEFQMIPPTSNIKWKDTGDVVKSEDAKIGKLIPTIEYSLSVARVASVPWATIRECIGKINEDVLDDFPFSNVGIGTMLFAGAEIGFSYDALGDEQWSLDYKFHERLVTHPNVKDGPAGWNHIYRAKDNTWALIQDKNGDEVGYQYTLDFMDLLS